MPTEGDERRCTRCGGETRAGGLRDTRGLEKRAVMATWVPPGFKSGFMTYTVPGELPVIAARCLSCGHIDLSVRI